MTERTDQRICIKFCFNLGKSCTETVEMIQKAFVDESMGITQIKEWYRWLKSTPKSEPCQVNADYFFRLWGCCALRICSKRSGDQERILRISFEKIAWCREKKVTAFENDAPGHSSNLVQQYLAKHKVLQLCQPPHKPDIAPCDFWMFLKLKMALKGKQFDDIETIQSNATRELKANPKSAFEDCFKMWKHRWERVVQSNGDYFEECHGPDDEE